MSRRGSIPLLPQELYDRIIGFLWDDAAALCQCRLVCPAFFLVANDHLERFKEYSMDITSKAELLCIAHTFMTETNRTLLGIFTKQINIVEDLRAPFGHLFPILIPGSYVPNAKFLLLEGVDWVTVTPHSWFFDRLSRFTSVTVLSVTRCQFGNVSQLSRAICALPNLGELRLKVYLGSRDRSTHQDLSTTTPTFKPPSSPVKTNHKLTCIAIDFEMPRIGRAYPSPPQGCTCITSLQNIFASCSLFPSVSELHLDSNIWLFDSPTGLIWFLGCFHKLRTLRIVLHGRSRHRVWSRVVGDDGHSTPLRLTNTQMGHALQHLQSNESLQLAAGCCKVENVVLHINKGHSPDGAALLAMAEVLRLSGDALKSFEMQLYCSAKGPYHHGLSLLLIHNQCMPHMRTDILSSRLSFATNTSLESVRLYCDGAAHHDVHDAEPVIVSIISSINSPYIKNLTITLRFGGLFDSPSRSSNDSLQGRRYVDDVPAFHATLQSDIFRGLPMERVRISVRNCCTDPLILKSRLSALLVPWVARGLSRIYVERFPTCGELNILASRGPQANLCWCQNLLARTPGPMSYAGA